MHRGNFFYLHEKSTGLKLADFISWIGTGFSGHIQLFYLSAFIVAYSIYGSTRLREEHMSVNEFLITPDGFRVAVSSSAYIWSPDCDHPDHISFCKPSGNGRALSDIYIFCLYKGVSCYTSPLNLDLWDFYIITGDELSSKGLVNTKITLPKLLSTHHSKVPFHLIKSAITSAMEQMNMELK